MTHARRPLWTLIFGKLRKLSGRPPPFDLVEDRVRMRSVSIGMFVMVFLVTLSIVFSTILKDPVLLYGIDRVHTITVFSNPFHSEGFLDRPFLKKSLQTKNSFFGRCLNAQGIGVSHASVRLRATLANVDPQSLQQEKWLFRMGGMHMPIGSGVAPCSSPPGSVYSDQLRFSHACTITTEPSVVVTDQFGFFRFDDLIIRAGFGGTIELRVEADGVYSDDFQFYVEGQTYDLVPTKQTASLISSLIPGRYPQMSIDEPFPFDYELCARDPTGNALPGKSVYLYSYSPSQFPQSYDGIQDALPDTPWALYTYPDMLKIHYSGMLQQRYADLIRFRSQLITDAAGCVNLKGSFAIAGHNYPLQYIAALADGAYYPLFEHIPIQLNGRVPITVDWLLSTLPLAVREGHVIGTDTVRLQVFPARADVMCIIHVAGTGQSFAHPQQFLQMVNNPSLGLTREIHYSLAYTDEFGVAAFPDLFIDVAGDANVVRLRGFCNGIPTSSDISVFVSSRVHRTRFTLPANGQYGMLNGSIAVCSQHLHMDLDFSLAFFDEEDTMLVNKNARFRLAAMDPIPSYWKGPSEGVIATVIPRQSYGFFLVNCFIHAAIENVRYALYASADNWQTQYALNLSIVAVDCRVQALRDTVGISYASLTSAGYMTAPVALCNKNGTRIATHIRPVPSTIPLSIAVGNHNVNATFTVRAYDQCHAPHHGGALASLDTAAPIWMKPQGLSASSSFWSLGFSYQIGTTSVFESSHSPVSLDGITPFPAPNFTAIALLGRGAFPPWARSLPCPSSQYFQFFPKFRPSSLPTVDTQMAFSFLTAFRTDAMDIPPVRLASSVDDIQILSTRSFYAPQGLLYSIVVTIFPDIQGVEVALQVFLPPAYTEKLCTSVVASDFFTSSPLKCVSLNETFLTLTSSTDSKGLANFTVLCPYNPGNYTFSVRSTTHIAALPGVMNCGFSDVNQLLVTSQVSFFDSGLSANGSVATSAVMTWTVAAFTNSSIQVARTLFARLDVFDKVLNSSKPSGLRLRTVVNDTVFQNDIVPCTSFSGHASQCIVSVMADANELDYRFAVLFAPNSAFEKAAYTEPFVLSNPISLYLCEPRIQNGTWSYAALQNSELLLETTQGFVLSKAMTLCMYSSVSSNESMVLSARMEVVAPQKAIAIAQPYKITLSTGGKVAAGQTVAVPVDFWMEYATPGRYQIRIVHGKQSTVCVDVDVFGTAVAAVFLPGFNIPAYSTVYVEQLIHLKVKTFCAKGLPVPLKRVTLIPLFIQDVHAANSSDFLFMQQLRERLFALTDTSNRGNALFLPSSDVNVTELSISDASVFGVAQFTSFRFIAGVSGLYVIGILVDDILIGTSEPFTFINTLSRVELTVSNAVVVVPGVQFVGIQIRAWNFDGSPGADRFVTYETKRLSCGEFTKVCLVDPAIDKRYLKSTTDPSGSIKMDEVFLSAGSDGEYLMWVHVAGVPSNKIALTVRNIGNIALDMLDAYQLLVFIACSVVIPGFFANIPGQSWWPLVVGFLDFGTAAVLLGLLYDYILFNSAESFQKTSYMAMIFSVSAFAVCCWLALSFLVLLIVRPFVKQNHFAFGFPFKKLTACENYVRELFKGPIRTSLARDRSTIAEHLGLFAEDILEEERRSPNPPACPSDGAVRIVVEGAEDSEDVSHRRDSKNVAPERMTPTVRVREAAISTTPLEDEGKLRKLTWERMQDERNMSIVGKFLLFCRRWKVKGFRYAWKRARLSLSSLPNPHAYLEEGRHFFYSQRFLLTLVLSFLFLCLSLCALIIVLLWTRYLFTIAFSVFLQYFYPAMGAFNGYSVLREERGFDIVQAVKGENVVFGFFNSVFAHEEDVLEFFSLLILYVELSGGLALSIAFVYVFVSLILILQEYKRRLFEARQGRWFFQKQEASVQLAGQYTGFQVGGTLVCFVIVAAFLWILIFALCWEPIRAWLFTWLLALILSYLFSSFVFEAFLYYVVSAYLAENENIIWRRVYAAFDFVVTVLGVVSGLLSNLMYTVYLFFWNILFIVRLDQQWHVFHVYYCSMFLVDLVYNSNPVGIMFCYIHCVPFINQQRNPQDDGEEVLWPLVMQRKAHWDGDPSIDDVPLFTDEDYDRLVTEFRVRKSDTVRDVLAKYFYHQCYLQASVRKPFTIHKQTVRQRTRNLLWLAISLSNNPSLLRLRKGQLYAERARLLREKYSQMLAFAEASEKVELNRQHSNSKLVRPTESFEILNPMETQQSCQPSAEKKIDDAGVWI